MEKEEDEKLTPLEIVMWSLIIILLTILLSIIIIKVPSKKEYQGAKDILDRANINLDSVKGEIDILNEKALNVLSSKTTLDEFERDAKPYFTTEMLNKLKDFYQEGKGVCLDTSLCNVDGGYLESSDNRKKIGIIINKFNENIIYVTAIYGEACEKDDCVLNIQKQNIEYKIEDNMLKINNFEIKDYR